MSKTRLTRRDFLQTTSKAAGMTFIGSSAVLLTPSIVHAQTNTDQVRTILKQQIQTADVAEFQLRQYLMNRVPPLPAPSTAEEWNTEQKRLRKKILDEIIFHGWPKEWVDAPPKFED